MFLGQVLGEFTLPGVERFRDTTHSSRVLILLSYVGIATLLFWLDDDTHYTILLSSGFRL